jgi:hypothetical protein
MLQIVGSQILEKSVQSMDPANVEERIWVWFDFVKPGKSVFGVYANELCFVHKFIGTPRTDPMPQFHLSPHGFIEEYKYKDRPE